MEEALEAQERGGMIHTPPLQVKLELSNRVSEDAGQLMAKFIKSSDWTDRRNFNFKKKGEVIK
jgi:hypothetical protein